MTDPAQPSTEEILKIIEQMTGVDLTDDSERPVTFTEISIRKESAWRAWSETGDKKWLDRYARANGLLKAMVEKASEGKTLHLKPSELSSLLSPFA